MHYCVVIRQLGKNIPVVCSVIPQPEEKVDDLNHYFRQEAEDAIRRFKAKFLEFESAQFYIQVIDSYDNSVVPM